MLLGATALAAAPLAAQIELPGCLPPAEVAAASALPAELSRGCGTDPACWNSGLERAAALVRSHGTSYDAHRIRVLVARAAQRALGAEPVAPIVAEYRELAARHPGHPAYPHLLAQLALEGAAYEEELARIAGAAPDYPWAPLSIAYLLRPDSDAASRARSLDALDRFVALCPLRYEPAIAWLERLEDPAAFERFAGRLRAGARMAGDVVAADRLWRLGSRLGPGAGESNEGWLEEVRGDLAQLVAGGLPEGLAELAALRRGYELVGDAAGGARVEARLLEVQPCSAPALTMRVGRLRARLADAPWLGLDERRRIATELRGELEPLLARCGDEEGLLTLEIETLALLGPEAGEALRAAVERWLALPDKRRGDPELWAAERLLEADVALDRAAALLAAYRAGRPEPASDSTGADGATRRRELRLAASLALAGGDVETARRRVEELRAATAAAEAGAVAAPERALVERIEAGLECAAAPGEAALARWAPIVAIAPEAGAVEREARRCWLAVRGGAAGFEAWRAGRSRIAEPGGPWRTVDEEPPAAALYDLGRTPFDLAAHAGKTVFLRAWAGWCGPCREELGALAELARRFEARPDVVIRLVSVDDDPSPVIGLLARDALAVEPLLGGAALLDGGGLERVPAAWIVSPAGRVVRRQTGPAGDDPAAWVDAAAAALAEVAGPAPAPVAAP
jgi:thiol-disulfide isomerase/thioredoxin